VKKAMGLLLPFKEPVGGIFTMLKQVPMLAFPVYSVCLNVCVDDACVTGILHMMC